MSTPAEEVVRLGKEMAEKEREIAAKQEEILRLQRILVEFPDVQVYHGRWGRKSYFSKSVNAIATGCEVGQICGCCADADVEAKPYIETANGRVYSDPLHFRVGISTWSRSYIANYNWESELSAAGVSEVARQVVRDWFGDRVEDEDEEAFEGPDLLL